MGFQTLVKDLGGAVDRQVMMDASAAKAIIERRGIHKVRHLDVDILWLQQEEARRLMPLQKIKKR